MRARTTVAYFSMEIGLRDDIPTYAGGLGLLAGDLMRAAADIALPLVGVSLVYRRNLFQQRLDADGNQCDASGVWHPEQVLVRLPVTVEIQISGRKVRIGAWRHIVRGARGHSVPVYLLDTDLEDNEPQDRRLTDHLYRGDSRHRLCQEVVLGIGGVRMLEALGHAHCDTYHMNEGHSALLTLALLEQENATDMAARIDAVRHRCTFTTHTPVAAGHDRFDERLATEVLGEARWQLLRAAGCCGDGTLNMTRLALQLSRYVNAVATRHRQISTAMFPGHPIDSITNGVHAATWAGSAMASLFDRAIPGWREDNLRLRDAIALPDQDVWDAHLEAKRALLAEVHNRTGTRLPLDALTIGFARRATGYKSADLILHDPDRLAQLHRETGPVQLLFAGRAHPDDLEGQEIIRRIFGVSRALAERGVSITYLQNHDWALGRLLVSGSDLWLNTPRKPLEASGTSGMKAAINGVPSLSVLDGWWIEGHVEDVTGWAIDQDWREDSDRERDAASLYRKLETLVLPRFHRDRSGWIRLMRQTIAINGAHFNAQRMAQQYAYRAYQRPDTSATTGVRPDVHRLTA